jgi:hypothetical protein
MQQMNWSDINLFQYQQLVKALSIEDDIDKTVKLVSIVTGMTENQVLSLSIADFNKEKQKLNFLSEGIQGKPVNYINVNGRRYECIYDVRNIPAARYIESKVFGNDLVNNIHKIAATMVLPMKKTIFGWKRSKYDAANHEQYAQDMLEARFVDVYHSAVFFLSVYLNWIKVSQGYLMEELKKKKIPSEEIEAVQDFLKYMDGTIPYMKLPDSTILKLMKHGK